MTARQRIDKIVASPAFPLIFIFIAIAFALVYSYTTSPLFVFEGMDSGVFKSMGLAILNGKTPYVDFFDHKGPVLYFINALGQLLIPGRTGVFCLQTIGLFIVFWYLFKIGKLFSSPLVSFIVTIITIIIYSSTYEGGNLCEEWELIAITISEYYALKYILQYDSCKTPTSYLLVFGVCLGFAFFIRPNDAVAMIGGLIFGLLLFSVYRKEYKYLLRYFLFLLCGFLIIAVPVILYFAIRNAIPDLYYGMIQHNMLYSGGLISMAISAVGHHKLMYFLLFFCTSILVYKSNNNMILFILVPQFVLAWLLTGTRLYPHYFTVFVPFVLLFWIFTFKQSSKSLMALAFVIFYMCSCGSYANYIYGAKNALFSQAKVILNHDSDQRVFYDETEKLFNLIPAEEQNDIWNYNLSFGKYIYSSIFFHHGIVQCNMVPFFPMYMVDQQLKEIDSISEKSPKWIILSHESDENMEENIFDMDYEYIESNYSLVYKTDSTVCNLELYHLNK